ncbi:hypothetical protein [Tsukamurella hominis]|uniref:hypothetical protein n=1 Tax=Tsukamurella hominis TaxID=1970232 RepID=UPI0039E973E9
MPLVDVTCSPNVTAPQKRRLSSELPHWVSVAVECSDEPYDGDLQPGDVIIRFHDPSPFDRFDLDILVEVHSKWFEDRAANRASRAAAILAAVESIAPSCTAGVYLSLPHVAWDQSE